MIVRAVVVREAYLRCEVCLSDDVPVAIEFVTVAELDRPDYDGEHCLVCLDCLGLAVSVLTQDAQA